MKESIFDLPWSEWGTYQIFELITNYLIPIIASMAVIIGGFWTVYKYFNEKNRKFYQDILEKVYAPLFNELVKNEFSRKLIKDSNENKETKKEFDVKEEPFIVWCKNKVIDDEITGKTKVEEYNVFNMDDKLMELYKKPDRLKYAPRDLVALVSNYFFLDEIKGAPTYDIERLKIKLAIRRNVIIGYKKYRRKLGLRDISKIKYCRSFWGWISFK